MTSLGGRTVYTGGTFDLFHAGHAFLLRQCRDLAGAKGRVVVSLNSDEFVQAFKQVRPTHPYRERKVILEACRFVDLVVRNIGGADSRPTIEVVQPDVVAIGDDWYDTDSAEPWGRYMRQMCLAQDWLDSRGIELVALPLLPDWSSSRVRRELAAAATT